LETRSDGFIGGAVDILDPQRTKARTERAFRWYRLRILTRTSGTVGETAAARDGAD
jgi:hypothetical protein